MKKQINSVSNWSLKGIISVTILSAMLCALNTNANNKPSVGDGAKVKVESVNQVESLTYENAENIIKYNANEFVQTEITDEIENRINSETESWIPSVEAYNANEFVLTDMADETERWMNIDAIPNNEEVEVYNANEFVQIELANELESWLENNSF